MRVSVDPALQHGVIRWGRLRAGTGPYSEIPTTLVRATDPCGRCGEPLVQSPLDGGLGIPRADQPGMYETVHYECFCRSMGSIAHLAHLCSCYTHGDGPGLVDPVDVSPREMAQLTEAYAVTFQDRTTTKAQSTAIDILRHPNPWEMTLPMYTVLRGHRMGLREEFALQRCFITLGHILYGPTWIGGNLAQTRALVPPGLMLTPRAEQDEEVIEEVWV